MHLDSVSQEKIAHGWMGWVLEKKRNNCMEVLYHIHSHHWQIFCLLSRGLELLLLLWSRKTLQMEISLTKAKVKFKWMILNSKIKFMEFIWSLLHDESLSKHDYSAIEKQISNRTAFTWPSPFCLRIFFLTWCLVMCACVCCCRWLKGK